MTYDAGQTKARYVLSERIPLRAMVLEPAHIQGIALPDGRFIFGGNQTYSSEAVMLKLNPGATIVWLPEADATINHVMGEDD